MSIGDKLQATLDPHVQGMIVKIKQCHNLNDIYSLAFPARDENFCKQIAKLIRPSNI